MLADNLSTPLRVFSLSLMLPLNKLFLVCFSILSLLFSVGSFLFV
jgi:hypothetical protein